MTNADRVKAMTVKQLADFLEKIKTDSFLCGYDAKERSDWYGIGFLEWLKADYDGTADHNPKLGTWMVKSHSRIWCGGAETEYVDIVCSKCKKAVLKDVPKPLYDSPVVWDYCPMCGAEMKKKYGY